MWLGLEKDRKKVQRTGFRHVKKYENYTVRAKEILDVMEKN